jgi:hypothetical protein
MLDETRTPGSIAILVDEFDAGERHRLVPLKRSSR